MKYPMSLSDAWVDSCIELWEMRDRFNVSMDKLTIWDGFMLLYNERVVSDDKCGRKSKGATNVTD